MWRHVDDGLICALWVTFCSWVRVELFQLVIEMCKRTSAYIYYRLLKHNDNTCCKMPGRTAAVSQILQLLGFSFAASSIFFMASLVRCGIMRQLTTLCTPIWVPVMRSISQPASHNRWASRHLGLSEPCLSCCVLGRDGINSIIPSNEW